MANDLKQSDKPPVPSVTGSISDLKARHLDRMIALFQQGQQPHHQAFPDHFGPGDNHQAIAHYLKAFLPPKNPFRSRTQFAKGWFVDGAVMGYLIYQLYQRLDVFYGRPRWACFVEDITIDQSSRASGGASFLIDSLLGEIDTLPDYMLSATVWNGNAASQKLFEKYGFTAQSSCFYRMKS